MKRLRGSSKKNKEESCSFLDAIGRRSCGSLSGLTKIDMWKNPSFDSSGSRQLVDSLRCALSLSSNLHFNSRSSLACLSSELLDLHAYRWACYTESKVHASGKFCSISDPPPPPSLSLSLILSPCDQIREKESLPLNTTIRTSKRKFAKCGHQVQVSHSQHAVADSKEKMQSFFLQRQALAVFCEFRTTSDA